MEKTVKRKSVRKEGDMTDNRVDVDEIWRGCLDEDVTYYLVLFEMARKFIVGFQQ